MTIAFDASYWDDATNSPQWPTWPATRSSESFNPLVCEPWDRTVHGVDRADEGGSRAWPALLIRSRVVAKPLVQVQRESRTIRAARPHDEERKLTPMTAYDHDEHIRAIAGDGLIGESFEQRRRRKSREARLRLTIWTLILVGCLAGWSILAWSFVQLFQHVQGR